MLTMHIMLQQRAKTQVTDIDGGSNKVGPHTTQQAACLLLLIVHLTFSPYGSNIVINILRCAYLQLLKNKGKFECI